MTPRIEIVSVAGPTMLCVKWKGNGPSINVNLANWIATGGEHLAALTNKEIFGRAVVGNCGAAVIWDDSELAIDATLLMMLANEQKFGAD